MSEDFTGAKRGAVVPADPNKERITIRLDRDLIDHFRGIVSAAGGGNYQTLINNALRAHIEADEKTLEKRLRKSLEKSFARRAESIACISWFLAKRCSRRR